MSVDIRNSYLELLKQIVKKRPAYQFPKYCSELLSNPDNSEPILLNRVYTEFQKELVGPLELINITLEDIPIPPSISQALTVSNNEVKIIVPILDKNLIQSISKSPGASYDNNTNTFSFPLSPAVIPYLRTIVKELNLKVSNDDAVLLKNLALNSNEQDLSLAYLALKENKIYLKLRFPFTKLSEQIAKFSSTPDAIYAQEYFFPLGLKDNIVEILTNLNVATIYSSNFHADTTRFEPFDFDGNANSLSSISILELKGVKDKRANKFLQYGIKNISDLVYTFPRRYIDKSNPTLIKDIREGEEAAFIATVASIDMNYARKMLKIVLQDKTSKITATFFNSPWLAKKFQQGEQVLVYGKAEGWGSGTRRISLTNPSIEKFENISAAIIPIYPQSQKAGVSSGDIYNAVSQAIERMPNLTDNIDEHLTNKLGLLNALKKIHKPLTMDDVDNAYKYFVENELLKLQIFMLLQKEWITSQQGDSHQLYDIEPIIKTFPYTLTSAQRKSIEEIRGDLENERPMNRLLQGDVGSGKTLVAASSMLSLLAANPNLQGAIMAPTEILATQLYNEFTNFFEEFNKVNQHEITTALFTNKLKTKEKETLYQKLESGEIQLAVGTHALIAEKITFKDLAFVIIDEQHRFGVAQRAALSEKSKSGTNPNLLIMTATPIPRTAALTVFGSVDVSTIDELPPGRTPISTVWVKNKPTFTNPEISPWDKAISEIKAGRQVYVVCPLVEDNPKLELSSAEETYELLSNGVFKDYKVALVHGQQKSEEREVIMNAYKSGEINVLVSTTVIEVGVNVPNASVIVILDAERFGISQLHQLRGRVGRGQYASYCYLVSDASGPQSTERLQALVDSTDGFYLSEVDLQIRGHGQLFGEAQSGVSDLHAANLDKHGEEVIRSRTVAEELVKKYGADQLIHLISKEKSLDNIFRA